MTESESSFNLNCFEDDFDKHVEEINEYYEYLETSDFIEINWKCLGRRALKTEEIKTQVTAAVEQQKESFSAAKNDFEFEIDEPNASSAVSVSRMNQLNRTPKALNKKKSATTFTSVMEKLKKKN